MTDSAMFYPLFNKLQEKSIYSPKITDADVYLDFITNNLNNDELENAYQDFTKTFDVKSFDWMYYYVYIILLKFCLTSSKFELKQYHNFSSGHHRQPSFFNLSLSSNDV